LGCVACESLSFAREFSAFTGGKAFVGMPRTDDEAFILLSNATTLFFEKFLFNFLGRFSFWV